MSEIQFLASSNPFHIPREMDENSSPFFENGLSFFVHDLDPYWKKIVQPIFRMPYIYEARGLGNKDFWTYIGKHMEVGDVLELYTIPVQQWYQESIRNVVENPRQISINIGSLTYEYEYGIIKLDEKNG